AGRLPGRDRAAAPGGADLPRGGPAAGADGAECEERLDPGAGPAAAVVGGRAMKTTGTGEPTASVLRPGALPPPFDDPRVEEALEAFLAARQAGQNPDRQALFDRHPDLAAALRECLEGLDLVEGVAAAGGDQPEAHGDGLVSGVLGDFRIFREVG